ncbi:hypothetical protein [Nocardia sp. NPDC056000]|uniref:hypothetical protein n=1 Tax=Nocardia sp. NPDC056000 TaxID=3345674 RepID=UPI0035D75F11
MSEVDPIVAEWESRFDERWDSFWSRLSPIWRETLCGSRTEDPPDAAAILRRTRLTSDYGWLDYFGPIRCFPAVWEALLWDSNGMDLGLLAFTADGERRSWDRLLLGGPANVDLEQLRGTPIRELILSAVDVRQVEALAEIPGLESLTLDLYGSSITLPELPRLRQLTLYSNTQAYLPAAQAHSDARIVRRDDHFCPPFGPGDVA